VKHRLVDRGSVKRGGHLSFTTTNPGASIISVEKVLVRLLSSVCVARGTVGRVTDIHHRNVQVKGLGMRVAEADEGPLVLLLHGFPEVTVHP